jgi:CubicO group peptidase (beta-lactamase class C family)
MDIAEEDQLERLLSELRTKLAEESAAERFSGTVLVARNDTLLFAEACGAADRQRHIPNRLSTRFRIGSINKVFTLLTHTAGTGNIFGYLLLGAVIENVIGQSYYDYVDEHVYAPAGMSRSGSAPERPAVPDLAVGYTSEVEGSEVNTSVLPYRGTPAGGGYSTVEDLWRFATALTGQRLLDARHTALLTTGQAEAGWGGRCAAYGFFERTSYGIHSIGAAGGFSGMSADLVIYPSHGYVIAVLANMDPDIAIQVSMFIAHRLPITPPHRPGTP